MEKKVSKKVLDIIQHKKRTEDIVEFLHAHDLRINAKDSNGTTALHLATERIGDSEILQLLLDAGADIDARNNSGQTPFMSVLPHSNRDYINFFLSRGADITVIDNYNNNAIHIIAKYGEVSHLLVALQHGCDLHLINDDGNNALHCIAHTIGTSDRIENAEFLIEHGIDVNLKNKKGLTPLENLLHRSMYKNVELVLLLLENGAQCDGVDEEGASMLHHAIRHENIQIMQRILNTNIKLTCTDNEGDTPLHYATKRNSSLNGIHFLIEHGADINAVNNDGNSVLHSAIVNRNVCATISIIRYGANLNIQNHNGETPLHLAIKRNNAAIVVKRLIAKGAKKEIRNKNGQTALDTAIEKDNQRLVKLLEMIIETSAQKEEVMQPVTENGGSREHDELWDQIVAFIRKKQKCSVSLLQREFGIGYGRSSRIVMQLEQESIVSHVLKSTGARKILIPEE